MRRYPIQYCKVLAARHPDVIDYLNGLCGKPEYADLSVKTKIFWLLNGIRDFPKCLKCGKEITRNISGWRNPKYKYCSNRCASSCKLTRDAMRKTIERHIEEDPDYWNKRIQKTISTNRKNCGYDWYLQDKSFSAALVERKRRKFGNGCNFEKIRRTKLERYGDEFFTNRDKARLTYLEKYGSESALGCAEIFRKTQDSFRKNHPGYVNAFQLPESRKALLDKSTVAKRIETKRRNGTLNTSRPETMIADRFRLMFGNDDILTNWNKDKRYPYMADIYVKSLDLFVECNFHWTHGGHWFDENNRNDLARLETLRKRSAEKHRQSGSNAKNSYDLAIYVWTDLDVRKKRLAAANGLNYVVFWTEDEAYDWFLKKPPQDLGK